MKKFFYLLLLLIPLGLTSCHDDDDDLPNVDFDVTFQDAAIGEDGVIYVVQGESFSIEGVKVINREAGKSAIITSATYFWDRALWLRNRNQQHHPAWQSQSADFLSGICSRQGNGHRSDFIYRLRGI